MIMLEGGPLRPEPTKEGTEAALSKRKAVESEGDSESEAPLPPRIATGIFAPDPEEQIRDAKTLLEKLNAPHDLEAELDVADAKAKGSQNIEKVTKALDEQNALRTVRTSLDAPQVDEELHKKLEVTKERLEEEQRHIEVAEKYENVFDEFGDVDGAKEAARTGKNKEGKHFRDKYGKEIDTEVAKGLASNFIKGGGKITWKNLKELGQVVDQILKDIKSAIKGVFGGGGGGEKITVPK